MHLQQLVLIYIFQFDFQDSKAELLSTEAADVEKCSKDTDTKHNPIEEISGDPEENVFPDQSPTLAIYGNSQLNTSSSRLSSDLKADTLSEFYEPSSPTSQEKVLVEDEAESPNFSRKIIDGGKYEVKESSIHIRHGSSIVEETSQYTSARKVNLIMSIAAIHI